MDRNAGGETSQMIEHSRPALHQEEPPEVQSGAVGETVILLQAPLYLY